MAKARYFNDKYINDDSIMTLDYQRKDGKLNIYYYQNRQNIFYSKACYEFMRLKKLEDVKICESYNFFNKLKKELKNKSEETTIQQLNRIKLI